MKHRHLLIYLALVFLCVWGGTSAFAEDADMNAHTKNTPIQAVIHDPAFGDYGRLIFPVDEGYMSGDTLGSLRLTWYNNIDPDKTVEIANFLRTRAAKPSFTISIPRKKKPPIPPSGIQACSSSRVRRARGSPCATRAAALPMWARCRTASRTRWSFPRRATTPLR